VEKWEMPKETVTKTGEGELVRLKYTFRYEGKFVESDDDWLKCIEATSDELLGPYSRAEDNALSVAFGNRKKKRLNRVFDDIGFMYPDYRYPSRGQKRKGRTSGKDDASADPIEPVPKRKKVKAHRPCYIEPVIVPEYGGETSSAAEAKETAPMQKTEEPAATPKTPLAKLGEPKVDNVKETEVERTKILEVISPSAEVTVSKAQKDLTVTPKRKRMVHVLDVLEEIKTSSSTPGKTVEASKTRIETKQTEAEAAKSHAKTEAGPLEPVKEKFLEARGEEVEREAAKQILPERTVSSTPEAPSEVPDYIVRHASGK
jgi:hypothetical protein